MNESKILEFKEKITNTFLKTVSAFSNYGEGIIQFGITDEGVEIGIPDPDRACLDMENRINDSIEPKPDYSFEINRRTNVISLIVFEGSNKPYLYKGKAYKRNHTSTVEVDPIELRRLVLAGRHLDFEMLPYHKQELSFSELRKHFSEKLDVKEIDEDILRTLGFFTERQGYNNAAGLFADQNDFCGVDIARFGDSIDVILDRETIANQSVLRQYERAAALYQKYYQYERIEGMERVTVELVPETAFREAVANAIVHREWDVNAHIRISMFSDRIEVVSPGGLPHGISREEYLRGNISNLRNPILGNVFFRLRYIEMFGTGIRRINEAYREEPLKPRYEIYDSSIAVTLPVCSAQSPLTEDEGRILSALDAGRQLSSGELVRLVGFGRDKTIRLLNSLVQKRYIRVLGRGRGTRYTAR